MPSGALLLAALGLYAAAQTPAPSVLIMNPAAESFASGRVLVTANAISREGIASVQFLLDGSALSPPLTAAPYVFNWNTSLNPDGAHSLTAVARDTAGVISTSAAVSVTVDNLPPLIREVSAITTADAAEEAQAKAPQKFLSPALRDGINDEAVFGAAAREVSIMDQRGKKVFHAKWSGTSIIWNCRDASGQIVPSGIYMADILTPNAKRVFQSFAVVK